MEQDHDKLSMHCPRCGSEAAFDQAFCRACGFSLEKVPQLVAEQHSSEALSREDANKLQKRQQKIERSVMVAGVGFMALVAMSLLSGLIYLMSAGNLPLVPGFVLLILLLVAIFAGTLATYSERLKKTLSTQDSRNLRRKTELELPTRDHEREFVSVTERTTNLLESNLESARTERKERDV